MEKMNDVAGIQDHKIGSKVQSKQVAGQKNPETESKQSVLARFEKKRTRTKGGKLPKGMKGGQFVVSSILDQSNNEAKVPGNFSVSVLSPDSESVDDYSKLISEYGGGTSLYSGYTSPTSN